MEQRIIKFRAWDKKEKNMLYAEKGRVFPRGVLEKNSFQRHQIIMQFTGLKDKKGKEIFEGDILNWDDECTILIKWIEDRNVGFGYEVLTQEDKNACGFDIRFYRSEKSSKVIGNIHKNPELLEATK